MGAHVAQSVEHFLGKEEVAGSIPAVGSSSRAKHPTPLIATHRCRSAPWPHVPRKTPVVIPADVPVFPLHRPSLHAGPRHRCVRAFPTVPVRGACSHVPLSRQSASGSHVHGGVFPGPPKKSPGRGAGAEEKEMKRLLESDSFVMSAEGMRWLRFWPPKKTKPDLVSPASWVTSVNVV